MKRTLLTLAAVAGLAAPAVAAPRCPAPAETLSPYHRGRIQSLHLSTDGSIGGNNFHYGRQAGAVHEVGCLLAEGVWITGTVTDDGDFFPAALQDVSDMVYYLNRQRPRTAYRGHMAVSQSRRARATRRRAGRMARADNDLTPAQWAAIHQAWGCCAYCGDTERALQKDCVQPLSRGGRYTLENVVPACGSCNASKSNDEVTSWLRRKKLDERAFLLRYREVVLLLTAP